ncbi:MAG: hypothetical protein IPN11_14655 [Opitutaceae bacterium]|nr:hypothetical protein [Opitutaceae bacterium]
MRIAKLRRLIRGPGLWCAVWVAGGLAAVNGSTAGEELEQAWRLGAQGLFTEATAALDGVAAKEEEARFTTALLLFNRQPRTEADLEAAIGLLSALTKEGTTPALRARSLYFRARAETLRTREGSPAAIVRLYEQLWREYPAQPFGQRALIHLLLFALYADEPRESVLAKAEKIEQQAEGLTDPVVRSQFHQVAARGYLHLGKAEARALEHLLKVSELGVARREAAGDLHVSIGQLAAELGRPALAREHFRAFLQEFPNDPRVYTIKALLAALPAE